MQLAQIIHSIVGVLFVAAILVHIYIGTIGMEGAFEAMNSGEVDVNWAKEHHSLWLQEEMGKSRVGGTDAAGRTRRIIRPDHSAASGFRWQAPGGSCLPPGALL